MKKAGTTGCQEQECEALRLVEPQHIKDVDLADYRAYLECAYEAARKGDEAAALYRELHETSSHSHHHGGHEHGHTLGFKRTIVKNLVEMVTPFDPYKKERKEAEELYQRLKAESSATAQKRNELGASGLIPRSLQVISEREIVYALVSLSKLD